MKAKSEEFSLISLAKNWLPDALQEDLLAWFEVNGRHQLPWKLTVHGTQPKDGETISPYSIWIAEVMLQQTQLKVVLPYWEKWMEALPSLIDLVQASEQEVLFLWQGLGYYSRARRLHQGAKKLFQFLGSTDCLDPDCWPIDLETWMALPGIGRTTAGSIISSAFDLPAPLLDGNVKRVLGRLVANPKPEKESISGLWKLSDYLLDRQHPRRFNQALMDLGSMVCTPHNPNCLHCPWNSYCIAYASHKSIHFPVKSSNKPLPFEVIGIGIVFDRKGRVLIDQRLNTGLLGGMWEFPGGKQESNECIQETIIRELKEELGIEVDVGEQLISLEHSYSHKRLRFIVHICTWKTGVPKPLASQKLAWVYPNELSRYPFPSANSKMISALLNTLKSE